MRDDSYVYPQPGYPSVAVNRSVPLSSFTYSARITVPTGLAVANGGRAEAWADRIAQGATIQDLAGLYRPGDPTERK